MTTVANLLNAVGLSSTFFDIDDTTVYTSIFIHDPIEAQKLAQFHNSVAKAHGEELLAKLDVDELQKDAQWTVVLTTKALYKFDRNQPLIQPRSRKDLLSYYSIDADLSNPLMFTTRLYKDNLKTSVKSSFMRIMGNVGAKVDLASVLQVRQYICKSEIQRDQFVWAMNKLLKLRWQEFIEDHVVPTPEIYQQHHFTIKQNRKGANQERLLVISTSWLYNVELSHSPPSLDAKWGVPIECMNAVSLEDNCQVQFYFEHDDLKQYISQAKQRGEKLKKNMIDKPTDTYIFGFVDEKQRAGFVAVLCHLHAQNQKDPARQLKVIVNNAHYVPPQVRSTLFINPTGIPSSSSLNQSTSGSTDGYQLTRKASMQKHGSTVGTLVQRAKQEDEARPFIIDTMEKIIGTTNAGKSHKKLFALYTDLSIKWGDNERKFKHHAKVISLMKKPDIESQLPPERRPNFIAIRTTSKPVLLIAPDQSTAVSWRTSIETLTNASNANAESGVTTSDGSSADIQRPDPMHNAFSHIDENIPVIEGALHKFVRGGKDSHSRLFCLYPSGIIKWGNNDRNFKYSAVVVEINQDISGFSGHELSYQDSLRFIRIKTTDKTLELLCPNQQSADRWFSVVNKVINPDYEDDQDEADSEE